MSERRTEKRCEVCLDAVWNGESGNYGARVTDLSEGGCYVDSLGEVDIVELLKLKLRLPNDEWLELTGAVAHETTPVGFGLRFVNLDSDQLGKIRSLLDLQPSALSD